jgi:hypothetical protein
MRQCGKRVQATSGTWPFHLLKLIMLLCVGLLAVQAAVGIGAEATRVVDGAFGLEFDKSPERPLIGATLDGSPIPIVLYNVVSGPDTKASPLPADMRITSIGWRHFEPSVLSPRLRSSGMRFFLLQTTTGEIAMIAALLPGPCDELAAFLVRSIDHKYQLGGRNVTSPGNGLQSYGAVRIWSIGSRQIAVTCGKSGYLLYSDPIRIRQWSEHLKIQNDAEIERARLDLLAQANRLLPGHDSTLSGAFGLLFDIPIPNHQSFPIAQKIVYDRVRLSPPYDKAVYEIELTDGGYPVRLVGQFKEINFDLVTKAFTSRFGMPFKERRNHVQYNINGDYLSLQRDQEKTRIAVVHTQSNRTVKGLINQPTPPAT